MFFNKGILDSKHPKKFEQAFKTVKRATTEYSDDDSPVLKAATERIPSTSNNSDHKILQKVKLFERYEDLFRSNYPLFKKN